MVGIINNDNSNKHRSSSPSSSGRRRARVGLLFTFITIILLRICFLVQPYFLIMSNNKTNQYNKNSSNSKTINKNSITIIEYDIDNEVESNEIIDWTDSIFQKTGGWDDAPIVIESHKLLFFTVPKNACSTFKKLFRRMMGYKNWLIFFAHNPETNGLKYLGQYPPDMQKEFMTSSDWTRAIFLRDPMERTLSAYMDKGLKPNPHHGNTFITGVYLKHKCCRLLKERNPICNLPPFTPHETNLTEYNFPFESFVVSLMRQCQDSHWNQQILRMKPKNWKWINFVGHFENMQNDTRRLLKEIGAYEEFGGTGWGKSDTNKTLSIFEKNLENHTTGSGNYMEKHYSPTTERLVLKYYRPDYSFDLFNFTRPENYPEKDL